MFTLWIVDISEEANLPITQKACKYWVNTGIREQFFFFYINGNTNEFNSCFKEHT